VVKLKRRAKRRKGSAEFKGLGGGSEEDLRAGRKIYGARRGFRGLEGEFQGLEGGF